MSETKHLKDFKYRWQYTEYLFEKYFNDCHPRAYVYRFPDFKYLNFGQGKRKHLTGMQSAAPQPSDFLVTYAETEKDKTLTSFMEVKATASTTSFSFKDIRSSQWNAAKRQTMASGLYFFVIEAYELDEWYKVPAEVFLKALKIGWKSLKFSKLSTYIWDEMSEYVYTETNC